MGGALAKPRPLTPRQRQILRLLVEGFVRDQRMPTYREIGKATGIASTNGVFCHLRALANKGYISLPDETPEGGKKPVDVFGLSDAIRAAATAHLDKLLEGA